MVYMCWYLRSGQRDGHRQLQLQDIWYICAGICVVDNVMGTGSYNCKTRHMVYMCWYLRSGQHDGHRQLQLQDIWYICAGICVVDNVMGTGSYNYKTYDIYVLVFA